MEIIRTVREMQSRADELRRGGKTIGIVPTMGFLHKGHQSLIEIARSLCDCVVTTLFVNPTQFGPTEDFDRYPRDPDRDAQLAEQSGTDILFTPEARDMYPEGFTTFVVVEGISSVLEGKFRPTHFRGVTTVVAKLFHIVKPHQAVFGQKDAQQVAVIRRMITDMNFDIQLVVGPILREPDGLAMSSRNVYLTADERSRATALHRALTEAKNAVHRGERKTARVLEALRTVLNAARPTSIDYALLVNKDTFAELDQEVAGPEALAVLAVRFGSTRLIDNMIIPVPTEGAG